MNDNTIGLAAAGAFLEPRSAEISEVDNGFIVRLRGDEKVPFSRGQLVAASLQDALALAQEHLSQTLTKKGSSTKQVHFGILTASKRMKTGLAQR